MWPGLVVVHLLEIERFEIPKVSVFGALALNSLVGTNLSDVLWAKSVILTSPLVATLGLSLTTPLAMVADFFIHKSSFSPMYITGAVLVVLGFSTSSAPWNKCFVGTRDSTPSEELAIEGDTPVSQ
jgi:solute carrier family 35, member F5